MILAAIGAFIGSLLTASVISAISAPERIRGRRRHRRDDRPYAL
jgi:hypothetical protein